MDYQPNQISYSDYHMDIEDGIEELKNRLCRAHDARRRTEDARKVQARELVKLTKKNEALRAKVEGSARENEMAGHLESMCIDESENHGTVREELVALQAQFDQVLGERNRFAALADQLTAKCSGLEIDLERAAQQVDEQQQRVAELENTVGEMDRAGVALEHQVEQMKKDREDLVRKGNACLSTISLLEISLSWRNIELNEKKQNEKNVEKKMQIIKDRVRKIRELLEPGLNRRECVEEGSSAVEDQLQLQPQEQQQAKQKQQQLPTLLLQPYYYRQHPIVQRASKRRRDQRDDANEDEAELARIRKR